MDLLDTALERAGAIIDSTALRLCLIHISEPTRLDVIAFAVLGV